MISVQLRLVLLAGTDRDELASHQVEHQRKDSSQAVSFSVGQHFISSFKWIGQSKVCGFEARRYGTRVERSLVKQKAEE